MDEAAERLLQGVDATLGVAVIAVDGPRVAWTSARGATLAVGWPDVASWWAQISAATDDQGRADVKSPAGVRRVFDVVQGNDGLRYAKDVTDDVQDAEDALRTRAELADARDQALAASRAKSAFLANMSHELRTPLNAILGYGEMLLEEAEDDGNDHAAADLHKILAAGRHLLQLVTDVLDLARIEAGRVNVQLGDIEVGAAIREVIAAFSDTAADKGIAITADVGPGLDLVRTDPTKLKHVLRALVSNAVKFTETGHVAIRAVREADVLKLVVKDTGVGIDEAQRERLFNDPYPSDTASARRQGGTGFGLQIARRHVEMLGGTIGVDSAKGQGSAFYVSIPVRSALAEAPSDTTEAIVALADAASGRPVLVIDDDPSVGALIARYLGREGLSVLVARDGTQGIEIARRVRPSVITLDVMLPGSSGWSVLQQLKATPDLADVPVIIVTMLDDQGAGMALGAADYLTKPLSRDKLVAAIKRHLRHAGPVLVVEDDDATRTLAERALSREGFEVFGAADGRIAIDWLGAHVPALILLDLLLPEVDGFGVLAWLACSERHRDVPVLVVTAMDPSEIDATRLVGNVRTIVRKGGRTGDGVFGDIASLARGLAATDS